MVKVCVTWVLIALLCVSVAWAGEADAMANATPEAYGYTLDDVAVNNGVVLYWYAIGYANCTGCYPETFAEMVEYGMPLRVFTSPFTGDVIDPDDGALDFDGDITYAVDGCYGPMIQVQTTDGVVDLPGYVVGHSDISVQFDPCCVGCLSTGCTDITECGFGYWGPCIDPIECICRVVQDMMWKSFELFDVLYGHRPADELAWFASGLAPVDPNYKEYIPSMDIEFVYKGDCNCCYLKKAYVTCCEPCDPCVKVKQCEDPCGKSCCDFKWCRTEKPCPDPCKTDCNKCTKKAKCDPCNKCEPKCEKKCDTPCKPKCETKCASKCDTPCKPKCETKCETKCDTPCKKKCVSGWCSEKPKCAPAKTDCNKCGKTPCKQSCKPKCGSC